MSKIISVTANMLGEQRQVAALENSYVRADFEDRAWLSTGGFHGSREINFFQDFLLSGSNTCINAVLADGVVVGADMVIYGAPFPFPAVFSSNVGEEDWEYGAEPMLDPEWIGEFVDGVTDSEMAFRYSIMTDPQRVRGGIASALDEEFAQECRTRGIKLAVAEILAHPRPNLPSTLFHLKHGWTDGIGIRDAETVIRSGRSYDIAWAIFLKVMGQNQLVLNNERWEVR